MTSSSAESCCLENCGRYCFYTETITFFLIWATLLVAGRSEMLRDPGIFWHVATGQQMLASGHVPNSDPYSFTFANQPWVADQWLAECGMASLYRLAGWDGLLAATAAILAGIYTFLVGRWLRAGFHPLGIGLILALVLLCGSHQFHLRPLVLTLVLFAVTLAWLVDVDTGRRSLRSLWLFVPLVLLWANLHAGVLGGLGTIWLCLAGWGAAWLLKLPTPIRNKRDAGEVFILALALAGVVVINPYGLDLPRQWWQTLSMPLPNIIMEHARLSFGEPVGWAVLGLAMIYGTAMLGLLPHRPCVSWLLPAVWFVLSIDRVRNGPLFAVVAMIVLPEILPKSWLNSWLTRHELLGPVRRGAGWPVLMLPLAALVAVLGIQAADFKMPIVGAHWARLDPNRWPVDLLPELQAIENATGGATPIFNDMNFGGYLIFNTPRLKVFVDDRCSLYGGDFLQAYDQARRNQPAEIERWRRQYGFHYAIVESNGPFDRYLSENQAWQCIKRTPAATLFQYSGQP